MFAAISASQKSKNPFRTNTSTPNPSGTQTHVSQTAETSNLLRTSTIAPERAVSPPVVSLTPSPPPTQEAFPSDLFEDPPPYTPGPSHVAGETTIEQGPARPFQPPPPRPGHAPSPDGWSHVQNNVLSNHTGASNAIWSSGRLGGSSRGGSLFQQLASSINTVVQQLNTPQATGNGTLTPHTTGHNTWSSYPGQQRAQQSYNWTPQQSPSTHSHGPAQQPRPLSAAASHSDFRAPSGLPPPDTSHRRHSSEFTRDFYAAGAAGEAGMLTEGSAEPHVPPLPPRQSSTSTSAPTRDGKPTSNPVAGHPLMNMGRVLVYPRGHRCEKCQNIGYKGADPNRPCNRCWNKYAKPFTGPVALSFSNTSDAQGESNLQRPLPYQPPPTGPPSQVPHSIHNGPPGSYHRPLPQHWSSQQHEGGNNWNPPAPHAPHGSSRPPLPPRAIPSFGNRPPPGAVVYTAGDPRIGGQLCWRCNGKGNVSILFDRMTCDVCNGLGRLL